VTSLKITKSSVKLNVTALDAQSIHLHELLTRIANNSYTEQT